MLNKELISTSIPSLKLTDSVFQAMELMTEFCVKQLPVVSQDKYIGLVFEEDLMNLDDSAELESVSSHFSKVSVHGNMHFIEAVQTANDYHLTVIPVIEKDNDFYFVKETDWEQFINDDNLFKKIKALTASLPVSGSELISEVEAPMGNSAKFATTASPRR